MLSSPIILSQSLAKEIPLLAAPDLAFENAFEKWYKPLVTYSFTIIKDADEAEDLVQQVFINFWGKKSWENAHTSLKAMLYTAVYNASLNKLEQRKVRERYANLRRADPDFELLHAEVDKRELQKKFNEALESLPEQCRRIFELSRLHQKKYKDIATELGISIKTVENQMGKALQLLRIALKDFLPFVLIQMLML
jgi:RNA polymerase sigma-70 factor (ECF subfamily)